MTLPSGEPVLASLSKHQASAGNPPGRTFGWGATGAGATAVLLTAAIWLLPQDLSRDGRLALIVLSWAIVGWSMTRANETLIGVGAASALAATGVLDTGRLFATLGHELIWLLVAAFAISVVLRASGLIERFFVAALRRLRTVRALFLGLTGMIAATAFVIPSTTVRAALLLPVFLTLAERIGSARIVRALALLFPTVILLSAGGSLIGAGAHIVAVDLLVRSGSAPIGYWGWVAMAGPFAMLSCLLAAAAILRLFLAPAQASARVRLATAGREPLTRQQAIIAFITLLTVTLWMTAPLHGQSLALIALVGAAVLLLPGIAPLAPGVAFKAVNAELIVFLATTLAIADALVQSGAGTWLAEGLMAIIPAAIGRCTPAVVALVAVISLLSHLVVASRTARATVLIPALALPLAGFGHDPRLLILVTVMGTGFCQTLPASAKAVAVFALTERPTCSAGDLVRLSAVLLPTMLVLLVVFALTAWS
jgi:di/tricarboxylate transporter